jgi:hypothetical protein
MLVYLESQSHHTKVGWEVSILVTGGVVLDTSGEGDDHIRIEWFLNGVQKCSTLGLIIR